MVAAPRSYGFISQDGFTYHSTEYDLPGELAGWFVGIFILTIALLVGLWYPLVSLIILAVTLVSSPILSYLSLRY